MNPQTKGSAEWFTKARNRCFDHLRALLSVRMAHELATALVRDWATSQLTTKTALHAACVIAYARPFTIARTKNTKVIYPVKNLKKTAGFDDELHSHIMNLRDRLIAHSDYGIFPSTCYVQEVGDEKIPLALGFNVKAMVGIENVALAGRYQRHLRVCMEGIENALNMECSELAAQSRLYPEAFSQGQNIPAVRQTFQVSPTEANIPAPIGVAGNVEEPSFPDGLSGYHYMMLRHQIVLIDDGKYTIHVDGIPQEITFSSGATESTDKS
jgi:hypothetical protein